MNARTVKRTLMVAGLFMLTGCLPDEVGYSPEKDDAAMEVILGEFGDGKLTLALCEDLSAAEAQPNGDCQIDHVVRAGGLGERHHEEHSNIGCGGCPFDVVAFVHGQVAGGPFGEPVPVRGMVHLGRNYGERPYAFPYYVDLSCEDETAPCSLGGTLYEDGRLELASFDQNHQLDTDLTRLGDTACAD